MGATSNASLAGGHGSVDLRHAIEKSCNVYFYTLGNMLGVDRIHKWAVNLGLHGKSGIDLPNEQDSLVPSSEWKRQKTGERWYPGETISVAIGQGQNSVTPMGLAVMMSTLANGGKRHVPGLVKAVDEGKGWQDVATTNPYKPLKFKRDTVQAIHDGLWLAVNAAGTAVRPHRWTRRGGQDGDCAGDLDPGARAPAAATATSRPWLVRVHGPTRQSRARRGGCRAR